MGLLRDIHGFQTPLWAFHDGNRMIRTIVWLWQQRFGWVGTGFLHLGLCLGLGPSGWVAAALYCDIGYSWAIFCTSRVHVQQRMAFPGSRHFNPFFIWFLLHRACSLSPFAYEAILGRQSTLFWIASICIAPEAKKDLGKSDFNKTCNVLLKALFESRQLSPTLS